MYKIKCKNCNNIFEAAYKTRKFCSLSCSTIFNNQFRKGKKLNFTPEYRKELSERMMNNNPAKQKKVRRKISKALKGRDVPWLEGKKRPEHSKFMKKYLSIHLGETNFGKGNPDFCCNGRSKLSDRVHNELIKYGNFISEYKIGRYFCDEVDVENKIIVEINGDCFHANPKIYRWNDRPNPFDQSLLSKDIWEHEKKRTKYLERKGYRVYFLWEYDIKKSTIKKECRKLCKTM